MSDLKKRANRLINEDSPYLLGHAYNPVDWYAWSKEAFERARAENKPIFLSIGYSACHWCHVMEREVFENEELAGILNERFVSIKVDREERPDIDKHFQHIHYVITRRSGGWPTSIFLTPDKRPFFAATYIPPKSKQGMMGFGEVVTMLSNKLRDEPQEVYRVVANIERIAANTEQKRKEKVDFHLLGALKEAVLKNFDSKYGGIMGEPKFPHAALLILLLKSKDEELISVAAHTLKCMAKGGMYDIVDGGFCRYSVDSFWLVPHFEKMAYDNALLIEAYAKAYEITKEPLFLRIAKECADFMLQKMSKSNLFYSASDADSEGEEGKYFVYSWQEAYDACVKVGVEDANKTLRTLGFSKIGNFEGKNIPRNETFESGEEVQKALAALKKLRASRVYPFIDKKIICSWNAMMVSALFALSRMDGSYAQTAELTLFALVSKLDRGGKLYHCAMVDKEPKIEAFFEDYAFLAKAYLDAHLATGNQEYKKEALEIIKKAVDIFYKDGAWMLSVGEFETMAEANDGSYSSPIGIACEVLGYFREEMADVLHSTMQTYSREVRSYPIYCAALAAAYL
jgi:hypothetical protein